MMHYKYLSPALFDCCGCGKSYPEILSNEHHIWPFEYGGEDEESNKVMLCAGCHQLLHYLAYRKASGSGDVESSVGQYLSSIGSNVSKQAPVLLEYIAVVCNKYMLYKQGIIKVPEADKKIRITLQQEVKELLRMDAKNDGRGLERHIQIILIRHLRQKFPGISTLLEAELIKKI